MKKQNYDDIEKATEKKFEKKNKKSKKKMKVSGGRVKNLQKIIIDK